MWASPCAPTSKVLTSGKSSHTSLAYSIALWKKWRTTRWACLQLQRGWPWGSCRLTRSGLMSVSALLLMVFHGGVPLDSCKIHLAISTGVERKNERQGERPMSGMKSPVETHRVASRFHYNVGKTNTGGPYWARVTWSSCAVRMSHAVGTLLLGSPRAGDQPPALTLGDVTGHTFSTHGSQGVGHTETDMRNAGDRNAVLHLMPWMNRLISYSRDSGRRSCRAAMVPRWQEQQELQLGGKRWQLMRGWKTS